MEESIMKCETIALGEKASLKTYLWDESEELAVLTRPAVLVIPGGGYLMCSDREAEPVALAYAAEGFQTFVLRYTVRQGFEAPFREAREALSCIRAHAKEWHIGEGQLAVCGFSAGGHLACALGTMGQDRPDAMILGYPAVLRSFWVKAGFNIPDMVERISDAACPAFIMGAEDDATVPIENEIALMAALRRNSVPFESHIYAKGGHGFSLAKRLTSSGDLDMTNIRAEGWFALSVGWLKQTVGDIALRERPTLPAEATSALDKKIGDLLADERTRAVLLLYSDAFAESTIIKMVSKARLADFVLSLGLSSERIVQLSRDLESVLA